MKKNNSSLFMKYLVSYSIVFVIPLIVLGTIMYTSFSQLLGDETDNSSMELLSSTKDAIDSRITELNKIAIQISQGSRLRITDVDDPLFKLEAVKTLNEIALTNNFISEILLYYKESNLLYSSSGTYRLEDFMDKLFKFEKWNQESFIRDMDTISKITMRPAERLTIFDNSDESSGYLTYIIPVPYNNKTIYGSLIFLIKEKTLGENLEKSAKFKNGMVLILDAENNVLINYGKSHKIDIAQLNKEILEGQAFSKKMKIEGKYYSVSSIKSDVTGWAYITFFPENEGHIKLMPIAVKAVSGFMLVVIIGYTAVYMLARFNYRPIGELARHTEKLIEVGSGSRKNKNEIMAVIDAVDKMSTTISSLQKKVEHSIPDIKNSILTKLVKGIFADMETFTANASGTGIVLLEGFYLIAALIINSRGEVSNSEIVKLIEYYSYEGVVAYGIDGMEENRIIVIISTSDSAENKVEAYLTWILEQLKNCYRVECTVGVGKAVDNISQLGNSYLEASAALDYRFVKGNNTIIMFNELENISGYMNYYPQERLEQLELCILNGDALSVINVLSEVFEEIKKMKLPIFYVRSFGYNTINFIIQSISGRKVGLDIRDYKYSDITSLTRAETIDELSIQTGRFCIFISSILSNHKNKSDKNKTELMNQYIIENFSNYSFSLQSMADHFDMSASNLSMYYKANSGENISEFVNRLRIEMAKKLLTETNENLDCIVKKIGYQNVSSFIRKFRDCMGMTPTNFRKITKK